MRRWMLVVVLLTVVIGLAASPVDESQPLMGFSEKSSRDERQWEEKFKAIPDTANLREYMKRMSTRPHHVGSPYDKDNAEWILAKFKEWGLDAHIETFYVLFPTPKERVVEMVSPAHFAAKLQEPVVSTDPTSDQREEQLPTYNAYSTDGDVRSEERRVGKECRL